MRIKRLRSEIRVLLGDDNCDGLMTFRAKPPEAFTAELRYPVREHQVLDVTMVDNILKQKYLRSALPDFTDTGWDLRLHYEIKANLTSAQAATLRASDVYSVQRGIRIASACCGRPERLCSSGPGRRRRVTRQSPGGVTRIQPQRFSPRIEYPALGFARRKPAKVSAYVYDLIVLQDRRLSWPHEDHVLAGAREQHVWSEFEYARSPTGLVRKLTEAGLDWAIDDFERWLGGLRERGLVFASIAPRPAAFLPTLTESVVTR